MTRLPSLGPRGEGWVAIQVVLLGGTFVAGWFGPAWDGAPRLSGVVAGTILVTAGFGLAVRGTRDLATALTPLPYPRDDSTLVETGIYARIRHPIYGGLVLAAVGWGLVTASLPALAMAVVDWIFFTIKSMREEAWLVERFAEYPAYRARTKRLIPWIG